MTVVHSDEGEELEESLESDKSLVSIMLLSFTNEKEVALSTEG
jgi:hypothetical protein